MSIRTAPVLAALTAVAALAACGDDKLSGKTDTTQPTDVEEIVDSIIDVISFDTEPAQDTPTDDTTPPADTSHPADSTAQDTSVQPDTSEGCNTFGCTCHSNSDCIDEYCIEGADGNICTRTCIADCPANFDCLSVTGLGSDPVSVCVPRHTRLCRPCRQDAECDDPGDPYPAYCLADHDVSPAGATGSFCGSSCANRACPEGYTCADAALTGGGTAKQCVPTTGECACRPSWADLGYSTDCLVTNTFGSCHGTRSCNANGLSPCLGPQATPEVCDNQDNDCDGQTDNLAATACSVQNANGSCPGTLGCQDGAPKCLGPEPLAESCNGQDDNCNGQTDENTCNDNLACTTDTCVAAGQCQNALIAGNCLVNGACYLTGQFNPQNPCEICDAAKSTASFTQAANTCVINQQCYPANTVNPDDACQICLPGQSTTSWSTASNTCTIGGVCYAANQANPANACEICSPVSSTTSFTQAFNTCNIQGQCFAAGVKNPTNECLVCDPTKSAAGWSNAANTVACEDSNACSPTSFCDGAGACKGDTSCNDNVSCTVDTCDPQNGCSHDTIAAGNCRINGNCYADNTANPTNPCQRCASATNQTDWSPQPTSVACSDNNLCTTGDACDGAGHCASGPGCSDGLSCTTDTCNPATGCSYPTAAGFCRISDSCYADNTVRGGSGVDLCYECDPATSNSQWTFQNNKSCNDGDSCTSGDKCSGSACSGSPIRDTYDANGSNDGWSSADYLGEVADGDGLDDLQNFTGTLYPSGDVDYYRYHLRDDTNIYDPRPHVELKNIPAASNYDLCVFWVCDDPGDEESITCDNGSPANENSHPGCCSRAGGTTNETVEFDTNCSNGGTFSADDETGNVYIKVLYAGGSYDCSSAYTVSWGNH